VEADAGPAELVEGQPEHELPGLERGSGAGGAVAVTRAVTTSWIEAPVSRARWRAWAASWRPARNAGRHRSGPRARRAPRRPGRRHARPLSERVGSGSGSPMRRRLRAPPARGDRGATRRRQSGTAEMNAGSPGAGTGELAFHGPTKMTAGRWR
jgi:hypothetical protein